jgi:hypothetical protein
MSCKQVGSTKVGADHERRSGEKKKTLENIGTRCDVTCAAAQTGEGERRRRCEKT